MIWDRIIQWFRDIAERRKTFEEFNANAREAFRCGELGVLFEARETSGDPTYRHPFSKLFLSSFTIRSTAGRPLTKDEMLYFGKVVLHDTSFTRKLYYLGWDTLRVDDPIGKLSVKWAIKDYVKFTAEIDNGRR